MQESKIVLAVDDEPMILEVVASLFESKGFKVFKAENGKRALDIFERESLSLVILDLMLPDVSGEELCRRMRAKSRLPIIMLTAKAEEENLLKGLEIGADDYITKPFSLKELYARSQAVLRRVSEDLLSSRYSFNGGDLVLDFEHSSFQSGGRAVSLTPNEIKLLGALIRYPGKVFTRAELIEAALNEEFDGYDRAIDSHIKNLRQKLEEEPKNPRYILTVHGIGYKFGGE
jgi:DNA-binding response OmpR family regulator